MFTLRNAVRNVKRSRGRSILIGIIITVIAFTVCIGLSIRESAVLSKKAALADMTITATISPDRSKMMDSMKSGSAGGGIDPLTLSDYKKYAKAGSVKSFYYTMSASLDASGSLEAYESSGSSSSSSSDTSSVSSAASSASSSSSASPDASSSQGGPGGMTQGDFTLTGYSSDEAMTSFTDGTCKITDGEMFAEGESDMTCVISDELAELNDLSVGDSITLANPNNEDETYTLKITGIYTNSQSSAQAMGGPGGMNRSDPANEIYCSYGTLNKIAKQSASVNSSDSASAVTGRLNATYVVGSVKNYKAFQKEVSSMGLSDSYTVSSSDIEQYERSAEPLENLAKFAGYFLIVIFAVGAVILVVMNIFSTRERKYEIGVLTAIGMKKKQVAKLFVTEILTITLLAAVIGGGIGAAVSTPVTNALLSTQLATSQNRQEEMNNAFGRNSGDAPPQASSSSSNTSNTSTDAASDTISVTDDTASATDDTITATATSTSSASTSSNSTASSSGSQTQTPSDRFGQSSQITVTRSVNGVVLLELIAACLALAAIASLVSVITIMRYEPLQILSNRD